MKMNWALYLTTLAAGIALGFSVGVSMPRQVELMISPIATEAAPTNQPLEKESCRQHLGI